MSAYNDDFDIYGDLNLDISSLSSALKTAKELSLLSSTVNQPNNEVNNDDLHNEIHLYGELSTLENDVKTLKENNEKLTTENTELKKAVELKNKQIQVLKNNISSLYKTAKNELDRRCTELAELRREYDSLIFRRLAQFKQQQQAPVNDFNNQEENGQDNRATNLPPFNGSLDTKSTLESNEIRINHHNNNNNNRNNNNNVSNNQNYNVNRGEKRVRLENEQQQQQHCSLGIQSANHRQPNNNYRNDYKRIKTTTNNVDDNSPSQNNSYSRLNNNISNYHDIRNNYESKENSIRSNRSSLNHSGTKNYRNESPNPGTGPSSTKSQFPKSDNHYLNLRNSSSSKSFVPNNLKMENNRSYHSSSPSSSSATRLSSQPNRNDRSFEDRSSQSREEHRYRC